MAGLIAADLDGTVVGTDLKVDPIVVEAFARARAAGWRTVIATGRMFRSALPFAQWLGVTEPLITYQGAWVRDPLSLETWWHRTIAPDVAREVIAAVKGAGLHLNLYRDDFLMVERYSQEARWYCEHAAVEATVVPSLEAQASAVTKFVAIAEADVIERIAPALRERFAGRLNVVRSWPRYLEFSDLAASKGQALGLLADRLGINDRDIVAFGDADNDADMLAMAGLGICVGNASALARSAAKRHTMPVGAGVAAVIDELLA
ncbi:MAG: Cof-type HAD-IIB family hydrolase [Cyanobacteria bacterium REEB65]|nr:Cof-type HAD-IIB family hydrolase [Cyanobacteria bacterium REEB65]